MLVDFKFLIIDTSAATRYSTKKKKLHHLLDDCPTLNSLRFGFLGANIISQSI